MAPHTYGVILGRNLGAARKRTGLSQADLAARMQALGFTQWVAQTVSKSERNDRRVLAEEVFGLAIVLETSVTRLMSPLWEDKGVELPSGRALRTGAVEGYVTGEWATDERIRWLGNAPVRTPAGGEYAERES
jgi:transcriptional regulator with XRE-family HTH domain